MTCRSPRDARQPRPGGAPVRSRSWCTGADLLASRGWPERTLVDEKAAQTAWLLAQHADHDPIQQRAFLKALRAQYHPTGPDCHRRG
jgi:hypothetical protein